MHKYRNKAAFLDRDGTINKNYGYVIDIKKFKFLKNVIPAIRFLKKRGFLVIVISNQSGIARGYFTNNDLNNLNKSVLKILKKKRTKIDFFYHSPYHPKFSKFSKEENFMRKPNPGMIIKAIKKHNIDIQKSFMIGDSLEDKIAANRAGIKFFPKKENLLYIVKKAVNSF